MPPFVSAGALVVDGDKLLVVFDTILQQAVLPGGHLRWREKPRDAVIREVREETGYRVSPTSVVAVLAGEEWAGEPGIVRVIFAAEVNGGMPISSGEGEPRWINLSDFANTSARDAPIVRLWLKRQLGVAVE